MILLFYILYWYYYECSNGLDDDGNGFIDYPHDINCLNRFDNELKSTLSPTESLGGSNNMSITPCTSDHACTIDHVCVLGNCVEGQCNIDKTCSADKSCDLLTYTCSSNQVNPCANNGGCLNDSICVNNACIQIGNPSHLEGEWILINGGDFMMGSEDIEHNENEQPIHSVSVRDFYMSKTEVTIGQYRKCVEAGVCRAVDSCVYGRPNWTDHVDLNENHPINCVDWHQARIFSIWVGGDLPSEAQWEYAAKSRGMNIKYPWGNQEANCQYAVLNDGRNGCGQDDTWEVCSKIEGNSVQELCDMSGNLWEWVLDEYHESYQEAPTDDKGWCSDKLCSFNSAVARVSRGGGWNVNASYLRSSYRDHNFPNIHYRTLGFRVSRSVN